MYSYFQDFKPIISLPEFQAHGFEYISKTSIISFDKLTFWYNKHCLKSLQIRSFSGPYSVQIRENTEQKNSVFGPFLRSEIHCFNYINITFYITNITNIH